RHYCFSFYVVFFFFQAEDGIRDRNVTGVQTCALPIWLLYQPRLTGVLVGHPVVSGDFQDLEVVAPHAQRLLHGVAVVGGDLPGRSEERRVGKECRSGWGG